ncbi:hypothetical protein FIU89_11690 [Roseovarius sp. THAF27]|uniref:excinuclease ABC subunit A n=1 Tax=Roseovarius sp. THAF27 TaxID=2587850 RepID=UPI0012690698|nr:excinuclease ABC subunit A [Roseovarius sp. THAF27]QFT81273.1 hypothetical protein FIU89_11690 [Roseovarius sp. THAF27]
MWKPVLTASIVAVSLAGPVAAKSNGCPPGLAKKAVPCVPPGQAKKHSGYGHDRYDGYRRGDVIEGDYIVIRDPGRYGLDPYGTYCRVGDQVLRVDRDTREVLDLIGAAARILN